MRWQKSGDGPGPQYRVRAADKALDILEYLEAHPDGTTLTSLSRATGIAKSTVFNTVSTLAARGFVVRHGDGTFALGPRLISMGGKALARLGFVGTIAPIMDQLVQTVQLTSHLAVRDDDKAMYVHKIEPPSAVRLSSNVGQRVSLFRSAVGKAILAFSPDREVLIATAYGTDGTHAAEGDRSRLHAALEVVRGEGIAFDDGEYFLGVRALAAPIFDHHARVLASIAVSGLHHELPDARLPELTADVLQAAQRASRHLGSFQLDLPRGTQ